jgi:CMP-N-acetylneuraminic acid synthetase
VSRTPVCIVPARGGSKRFPRKNVAPLGGKPLLAWTVDAARASGIFDRVVVSSEDEEILACAAACGAETIRRERELAGDDVGTVDVLLDAIGRLGLDDAVHLALPTSPLRRPETFRAAWQRFVESGAETLMSVVPFEYPPQWALAVEDGRVAALDPDRIESPRSALAQAWRHDGGHMILDVASFARRRTFVGAATVAFPVDPVEAVDVDEPEDLAWAEFLLERGTA